MPKAKLPKIPTIYALAYANRENGGRYFSRENMKAMGQRLSDFHVSRTEYPGIFEIEAEAHPVATLPGCRRMAYRSHAFIRESDGKTNSKAERLLPVAAA